MSTRVSLIVCGAELDTEEVTACFGFEPSFVGPGVWRHTISGRTSVDAPMRANTLARVLLDDLPAPAARWSTLRSLAVVRMSFELEPLLTFSFELESSVLARIAALGVPLECCVDAEQPDFDGFHAYEVGAGFEVWTGERDPAEVTRRLGIEPSLAGRAGEPIEPGKPRAFARSVWRLDLEAAPPLELNALVRSLLERLPASTAAWTDVCREHDAKLRFTFSVDALTGGFVLAPAVVAGVAALSVSLGCYFYNAGG